MITPSYAIRRSIQRAGWALDRLGLVVRRIQTPTSRAAGLSFQWRSDPQGNLRGTVVDRMIDGQRIWFFVHDDNDMIQRYHLRGVFYEAEELELIAPYCKGGLFADIGSNVGNHAIYALKFLGFDRVIAFEPFPPAYRVLETNMALNGLADRFALHKAGLSDQPGRAKVHLPIANIGGAHYETSATGDFEIVTGDSILADEPVTFLKIDTEGMEMTVLAGLRDTIARHRPTIFIEVEDKHIPEFQKWCADNAYRVEKTYKRYAVNTNFLVLPNDAAPPKRRAAKKQG